MSKFSVCIHTFHFGSYQAAVVITQAIIQFFTSLAVSVLFSHLLHNQTANNIKSTAFCCNNQVVAFLNHQDVAFLDHLYPHTVLKISKAILV